MSIETLKTKVSSLPAEERRKLMAFMVALEDKGKLGYADKLAKKMDDRSPARWLTAEQCERELGLRDESK